MIEIGYSTVAYIALAMVFLPLLVLRPHTIIYFLVIVTMFPFFFASPISIGRTNVYASDLLLTAYCFFAFYIVALRFIKKEKLLYLPDGYATMLILVLAYCSMHACYILAGVWQGVPVERAIRRFLLYSGCLYFFFPIIFMRAKNRLKYVMVFVVVLAILAPLWQIYSFMISAQWQRAITSSGTLRLGMSGTSLIGCALFAMLIWKKQVLYVILSASPILSLILVGHRSILLALGVSLIVLFMFTRQATKMLLFGYIGGLSILMAFIALEMYTGYSFIDDAKTRGADTFSLENKTSKGRLEKIENNLRAFKQSPLYGIGYNHDQLADFFKVDRKLSTREDGASQAEVDVLQPHNFVLRFLSHTGIIGTLLVFLIIAKALKDSYRLVKIPGPYHDIGVLLFCSLIFFIVVALMNTTFVTEGWFFWMICGVITVLDIQNRRDEPFAEPA